MSLGYKKISELDAVTEILLTDYLQLIQNSTNKRATLQQILNRFTINNSVKILTDDNYSIAATDYYNEFRDSPDTANKTIKMPDPTETINLYRKIKIVNSGDGTYKLTVNPYDTETFNVMSGNDEWTLSSFELLQSGDWAEFMCDGTNWIKCNEPYWHVVDDPATGWFANKTSGWSADSFSGGLEVTFTVPTGTIGCRINIAQATVLSSVSVRKSGDTNISNTPFADGEKSIWMLHPENSGLICTVNLSSDKKIQIAVSNTGTDIYVSYASMYLQ